MSATLDYMNPKRVAPKAIIDNLTILGDRQNREALAQSVTRFFVGEPLAGASDNYAAVLRFLTSYDGSSATFNAYRRELERLLQWSWYVRGTSVFSLTRDDIEDFIRFTLKPPLAWIGTKNVRRFVQDGGKRIPNPEWRPFVKSISKTEFRAGRTADPNEYVVSQAALRATFTALSSFYDYLTEEMLTTANPVKLIRQKSKYIRKDQNRAHVRRLSILQWEYVIETAKMLAENNPDTHERTLFIMTCLFAMYLRISELVADERSAPTMGDFRRDYDGNWWFHVTGKGNKDRTVTVSDAMRNALERYRKSAGFPALPEPNDSTPLIPKLKGRGPVTSTRMVRLIVQDCFDRAYVRMKEDGLAQDALELKAATVHWLRHTGISEDVTGRPREHVRDDAGHSSMATTDRYIESDRRERHYSGRSKQIEDF